MGAVQPSRAVEPTAGGASSAEAAVADLLAHARRRADLAHAVGLELAGSLNVRRIVLRMLSLLVPEKGSGFADWAMVGMLDPVHGTLALHGGHDRQARSVVSFDRERHPTLVEVTTSGGSISVQVADAETDDVDAVIPDEALREEARSLRPAEVLVCALHARGHAVGVLALLRGGGGGFPREDVVLAEQLASRFAMALDSARLYEDRAQVAAAIEKSLRPPALPELAYADLAAAFRPAAEHLQIGGDFYDAHAGDEDCVVVLGDVCGKGVDAAVLTGRARQSIRTAVHFDRRPATVLSTLNTVLYEGSSDRFVTVACARLRPGPAGSVTAEVAVAGHPPPLVLRADGTIEEVPARGRLAGVLPDVEYDDVTVRLRPGDTMLMFSDGIYEARGRDDIYGMERLRAALVPYAGCGPAVVCQAVEQAVVQYLAGHAHDDMTMLAVSARR
ncbi:MAG TPA: SpoIIE family protein phosphatase [Marmoricola sp.]|nr:SpoIIE family protein phosphatase [Marmoricola sp.]